MALDQVYENSAILPKCGSFWHSVLNDDSKRTAVKLAAVPSQALIAEMMTNAARAVLSAGYFYRHHLRVVFSDADIRYNGADEVLSRRYAGCVDADTGATVLDGLSGLSEDNYGAAEHGLTDEWRNPIVVPVRSGQAGEDKSITLPASYRAEFGLVVDPDVCVMSIQTGNGVLLNGTDFNSAFGYIAFKENPIALFSGMSFVARTAVVRRRNLYCYPLRLDGVYGPVDRVMHYYRVSQSLRSFRLAAAQACGMAVVDGDDKVRRAVPLLDGASYIMFSGKRYDAPYPHERLHDGAELPDGYVIGGRELFHMVLPDERADDVDELDTGEALPVRLSLRKKTIGTLCRYSAEGAYGVYQRPIDLVEGTLLPENGNSLFNRYWEYLAAADHGPSKWGDDTTVPSTSSGFIDSIEWIRREVCGGTCVIVRVNKGVMPYDMQIRLHNFIVREAPIGCVLTYAPLKYTIAERQL